MNLTTVVDPSSSALVSQVVEKTVQSITHSWLTGKDSHIVLTGGRTGTQIAQMLDIELFRAVSSNESLSSQVVLVLHIWFSDERYTDLSDPDRTDTKLIAEFSKVQGSNISIEFHRVSSPAQAPLGAGADEYAHDLDMSLGERRFDVVLLSMGEDGHVASLFPGLSTTAHSTKSAVAVDNSPKPPAERVSISVDRLAAAAAIFVFALGEGKREALANFLTHKSGPLALVQEAASVGQMIIATDLVDMSGEK